MCADQYFGGRDLLQKDHASLSDRFGFTRPERAVDDERRWRRGALLDDVRDDLHLILVQAVRPAEPVGFVLMLWEFCRKEKV